MGKSTLSQLVSDRLMLPAASHEFLPDGITHRPWPEVPYKIIIDTTGCAAFVVEGVHVARALRKGLEVDAVVYLTRPKVKERKPGQVAMAKGVRTVFDEWHAANRHVPVFFEGAK